VGESKTATRDKILEIAGRAFATRGFEQASLREIAEELGFSKAALYYHFRSKDDLARAIIEPMKNDIEAVMTDAETRGNVSPRSLLEQTFDVYHRHQAVFGIVMRDASILRALDMEQWAADWIARTQRLIVGPNPTDEEKVRSVVAIGGLARAIFLATSMPYPVVRAAAVDAACGALGLEPPRAK
jgi:AcrR family transcriptional regulator